MRAHLRPRDTVFAPVTIEGLLETSIFVPPIPTLGIDGPVARFTTLDWVLV